MGAPMPDMEPVENASAEALLDSLKTIDPGQRRKHASVFNYWQSIRAARQFPPIRDLDPLEISDAGPWSILLEMIGGGEDAVIRHFGQEIRGGLEIDRIADAPNPSLLSCIHAKLPVVAACREAFAFEDAFETAEGERRCWVTLLPFSANGTWIDFVYGYVSLDSPAGEAAPVPVEDDEPQAVEAGQMTVEEQPEIMAAAEQIAEVEPEPFTVELKPFDEEPEAVEDSAPIVEMVPEALEDSPLAEPEPEAEAKSGFTARFKESLANVGGFYGKVAQSGPEPPAEAFVEEDSEAAFRSEASVEAPVAQPARAVTEGDLQSKLANVRALAEEAREAQVRSNLALYEGLSAAYDFALEAEEAPEEYLRLVEAQGLKIQLRSPMQPVVKLAFDGMCDEPTIAKLEAVLAWALKHDLPRGTLRERIEAEGGLGQILGAKDA